MTLQNRLFQITQVLNDGGQHRAEDIAKTLGVSQRTIYRDMDRLVASGLTLSGTRGEGYVLHPSVPIPPMTLTPAELEALVLGLSVVEQAADPDLKKAAQTLSAKIEAATSTQAPPEQWQSGPSPFADGTRNLSYMSLLRSAIQARQKVRLTYTSHDGQVTGRVVRPLRMAYWGHTWALTAWCELRHGFRVFRLDLIQSTEALPELFVDEPGKRIEDYRP